MTKTPTRLTAILLTLLLSLTLFIPASAAPVLPTNDKMTVNGQEVWPAAYKIADYNYFRLRDIAALIPFGVGYENGTIIVTTGVEYTSDTPLTPVTPVEAEAVATTDKLLVNGNAVDLKIYKINGNNYFKLRDIAAFANFGVGYENGVILIDTSVGYVPPTLIAKAVGSTNLSQEDCYFMAVLKQDTYFGTLLLKKGQTIFVTDVPDVDGKSYYAWKGILYELESEHYWSAGQMHPGDGY